MQPVVLLLPACACQQACTFSSSIGDSSLRTECGVLLAAVLPHILGAYCRRCSCQRHAVAMQLPAPQHCRTPFCPPTSAAADVLLLFVPQGGLVHMPTTMRALAGGTRSASTTAAASAPAPARATAPMACSAATPTPCSSECRLHPQQQQQLHPNASQNPPRARSSLRHCTAHTAHTEEAAAHAAARKAFHK